jgi:signal peptidase I
MTQVDQSTPPSLPAGTTKPAKIGLLLKLTIGLTILLGWLAILARIFVFQPFSVSSESMLPTLKPTDYLWASKWDVGIRKIAPKRGDLIFFRLPQDPSVSYLKRVIGLPGDRVQMLEGRLVLNGTPVGIERQADASYVDSSGRQITAKVFKEVLPDGANYSVYDLYPDAPFDNTDVFIVPAGHYFMMGDNRDNSTDSRADPQLQAGVGFVPAANLIGQVMIMKSRTEP